MFPLGAWIWILRVFLKGSSPALEFSGIGSDFGVSSLGAAASGERLRFSFPVMSECGALIYLSESNSIMRYHRRSKAISA